MLLRRLGVALPVLAFASSGCECGVQRGDDGLVRWLAAAFATIVLGARRRRAALRP